jgi:hypothetical protein
MRNVIACPACFCFVLIGMKKFVGYFSKLKKNGVTYQHAIQIKKLPFSCVCGRYAEEMRCQSTMDCYPKYGMG